MKEWSDEVKKQCVQGAAVSFMWMYMVLSVRTGIQQGRNSMNREPLSSGKDSKQGLEGRG